MNGGRTVMQLANIEALVAPISPDDPCGASLEYGDPAFMAFERAIQGKPEQQIGSTIIPAEDPDWKAIGRQAVELLGRTKDLRVAVNLTKALLHTDGLKGLADGLTVVDQMVGRYWDGLHPLLDPEDGNDPVMRFNILAMLTSADILARVRTTPIVDSRTVGRFSLRDLETAPGDAAQTPNGAGRATNATIEAAAMECDLARLENEAGAAAAAVAALKNIESALHDLSGSATAPSFGPLSSMLQKISGFLQGVLARRVPSSTLDADSAPVAVPRGPVSTGGDIRSRDDVVRALERVSAYYRDHEPSSPIPLLIERCKRLVMMSFLEIVRELAPDGIKQIETLAGQKQDG
jgi:type VI secretion system protein ImpA